MKRIFSLDFIIIFIFGFLFLMNWDQAAILNFVVFFGLCLAYFWLDQKIFSADEQAAEKFYRWKKFLLFTIIGFVLAVTMVAHIAWRAKDPNLPVHDNIQQMEPAVEFLLQGKNPYAENYFKTELAKSAYIMTTQGQVFLNPALYHVIKLPFHILASVPVHFLAKAAVGFYDERMTYLILFILSLFALFALPNDRRHKFALTAFYAFNPLFLNFLVSGRDDVFVLSWLIFTFYFLKKDKILLSSLMLALACTAKHSAWFLVPFYYTYLYFRVIPHSLPHQSALKVILQLSKRTYLLPIIFLLIMLPFILWNPLAFYQDTIAYPAGTLITSYPINGYGLSVLFYKLGLVKSLTDYLPLWVIQIPITLLLFYLFIKKQIQDNSLARMIGSYAILILVYWLFSRFFHDNYVGFVSQLLLSAYFL
ncbi:MAG: hypothetical protein PHT40_04015 [Patescibacteria group bacterium]|nr:hypothetical protein [Patescibacteria group bacterium]